jgi:hypothetical protein
MNWAWIASGSVKRIRASGEKVLVVFRNCSAHVSLRPNAIEPARMIGPLRVAEIGRAASESVRCDGRPGWFGQVVGSFHHHDFVRCPTEGEAKVVRLDTKSHVTGLHLREPECGLPGTRNDGLSASGPGQVIDGCPDS